METNIKLVCSDLDGTLMQYGADHISEEFFDQVRVLAEKGIRFAPASGRQLNSLLRMFQPVAEHCLFLCENGGVLWDAKGNMLGKTVMPRELAMEVAWDLWNRSDGRGEVMLSGENTSYLMSRGRGMENRIREIGNHYEIVQCPEEVPEDVVKVSLYVREGVAEYAGRFVPKWQAVNAAVAGPFWIDTMYANKGTGIQMLCGVLGITPDQIMAFGDNYNDVAMLDVVGTPYIMESAAQPLLERYPNHTSHPTVALRAFLENLA